MVSPGRLDTRRPTPRLLVTPHPHSPPIHTFREGRRRPRGRFTEREVLGDTSRVRGPFFCLGDNGRSSLVPDPHLRRNLSQPLTPTVPSLPT